MLKVGGLCVNRGSVEVLKDVSLNVGASEVVAILGANGVGKTTLLNTAAGLLSPKSGTVKMGEAVISGLPAEKVVRHGLALVPERRQIFDTMTVLDNLLMGAYGRPSQDRKKITTEIDRIMEFFPVLRTKRNRPAGTLSGGEQQMLAIGRGLMSGASCLMLDEPSLGLAPLVVREVFNFVRHLKSEGVSVLVVEQNARAALAACDRAYVMDRGRIVFSGPKENLLQEKLHRIFLGGSKRADSEGGQVI